MTERHVETAIAVWADRNVPPRMIQEQCCALEATGALDGILLCDQLTNFIPRQLWTAENTPMARVMHDPDSHPDVFVMAAYIAAAAPGLDLALSTDSIRRGPAELMTTMLTLANITEGRVSLHVGGGEIKQTGPFGHPHKQGMSRMQDLFQIFQLFLESGGEPVDFEGRRWKLDQATIGAAMPYRPKIYGLGAGPMLLEYTARWADGLAIACPPAMPGPDRFAQERARLLARVEEFGRDPAEFRFAVWFPVLLADSREDLLPYLQNPMLRFLGALFGRIEPTLWEEAGLANPFPPGFIYYKDFLPYKTPQSLIDDALATVTDEHILNGWLCGSPHDVADQMQAYIDVGADWVCPMDYLPIVLEPEEAGHAMSRSIELCALVQERNRSADRTVAT